MQKLLAKSYCQWLLLPQRTGNGIDVYTFRHLTLYCLSPNLICQVLLKNLVLSQGTEHKIQCGKGVAVSFVSSRPFSKYILGSIVNIIFILLVVLSKTWVEVHNLATAGGGGDNSAMSDWAQWGSRCGRQVFRWTGTTGMRSGHGVLSVGISNALSAW